MTAPFALLVAALLYLGGALLAMLGSRWTTWILRLGAVLLLGGAVLLAVFVFSGDPYVNGESSRWSRRSSHGLVYAAWILSPAIAALLWLVSRRPPPGRGAAVGAMVAGAAVAALQAVAGVSQNLN